VNTGIDGALVGHSSKSSHNIDRWLVAEATGNGEPRIGGVSVITVTVSRRLAMDNWRDNFQPLGEIV
jgi:hypothetical protein